MKSDASGLRMWMVPLGLVLGLALQMTSVAADAPIAARVTFDSGGGIVKGAADLDWTRAVVNKVVLAGDAVSPGKGGNLEIETPTGTFLRMAAGSEGKVVSLTPAVVFNATAGSFYVQRVSRSSGDVIVETPLCKVAPTPGTTVRIDIASNGGTKVSVRWGRASVRYESGPEKVLEQWQRSFADPGYAPTDPAAFDPAEEDAFDSWSRTRARQLATGETSGQTQPASQPVSHSARWVNVDGDYYWNPGPYYCGGPDWCNWYGYGGWYSGCGYSPWGYPGRYITGHYGHWYNHPTYGRLWGFGDHHPTWATGSHFGGHHEMNSDTWHHGSPHGTPSSPSFQHAGPPSSSHGHTIGRSSGGGLSGGHDGGRHGGSFSGGGFSGGGGHGHR